MAARRSATAAAARALLDSLMPEMHTCGRCKEKLVEEKMTLTKSGPYRNNWLCTNEDGCKARVATGGRGARKRQSTERAASAGGIS